MNLIQIPGLKITAMFLVLIFCVASPQKMHSGEEEIEIERYGYDDFDDFDDFDEDMEEEFDEIVKEVEAFLKKETPSAYKIIKSRIKKIEQQGDEDELMEAYDKIFEVYEELSDIKEINPKAFERQKSIFVTEVQSEELGRKIKSIQDKNEREKSIQNLRKVLDKLFDLREQQRAFEATMIRKELEEIESLLQKRKANKKRIIERRIKELTGENEALDW